jgi:hypothetical protein
MHDVGWPDPAAVVDIIERILSRRAFSFTALTLEIEGPAGGPETPGAVMRMAPLPDCMESLPAVPNPEASGRERAGPPFYPVSAKLREPVSASAGVLI